MYRLASFVRQVFIEDVNIIEFGAAAVFTIFVQAIGIFLFGMERLLFPLTLVLVGLSVLGPIVVIVYLYRRNRSDVDTTSLGRLKSIVFGIYLGLIALAPIGDWNDQHRQKSGQAPGTSIQSPLTLI